MSRVRWPAVTTIFVHDRLGRTAIHNVIDIVLLAAHQRRDDLWQVGQVFGTMIHHASPAAAIVTLAITMVGAAFDALAMATAGCRERLSAHQGAARGRAVAISAIAAAAQEEHPPARAVHAPR